MLFKLNLLLLFCQIKCIFYWLIILEPLAALRQLRGHVEGIVN